MDLRLPLGGLTKPVAMALSDRLDANDASFEGTVWTKAFHSGASIACRIASAQVRRGQRDCIVQGECAARLQSFFEVGCRHLLTQTRESPFAQLLFRRTQG